jgi:hypothetical protein
MALAATLNRAFPGAALQSFAVSSAISRSGVLWRARVGLLHYQRGRAANLICYYLDKVVVGTHNEIDIGPITPCYAILIARRTA